MSADTEREALALAIRFHETYERLAPSFGYETRPDTKAFDPTTPNGRLMVAVCGELRAALATPPAAAAPTQLAADNADWSRLYVTASQVIARMGREGSIDTGDKYVAALMDVLHRLDAGVFVPGLAPRAPDGTTA